MIFLSLSQVLEKYMKRLSGYRASGPDLDRVAGGLEEDLDSPLYASPTAYGYAKIGTNKMKSSPATGRVRASLIIPSCPELSSSQSAEAGGGRASETQILAGFERGAERTSEFTFGHTGHMDIILGRTGEVGSYTTHKTTLYYLVISFIFCRSLRAGSPVGSLKI